MKYRYAGKYSANPGTDDICSQIPEYAKRMMDYRPPFEIIAQDIGRKFDGEVMRAVASVGVVVNKEELVAALQRERDQYKIGFRDGYTAFKRFLQMRSRRMRREGND